MIAKLGENKTLEVQNMTSDGIMVNIYLKAALVNVTLLTTDFRADEIAFKLDLKRNWGTGNVSMFSENLKIIGEYASKDYAQFAWSDGNTITYEDTLVKEEKLVSLFIPFGGCINLSGQDQLNCQLNIGRGVFTANIDSAISYIEWNFHNAIGIERGVPQFYSEVVQANITQDRYAFGSFVTMVKFLNFDKDNISAPVITTLSLNSDKFNQSFNQFDLFNLNLNLFTPPKVNFRYFGTLPSTSEAKTGLPKYPQSYTLFATPSGVNTVLNNCELQISYNGSNVNVSQNYVCCTRFIMSTEITAKALIKAESHAEQNLASIPS